MTWTDERVELLKELREGTFDVLVGVNLLREGLDLPEVSLVAILDADKEGYLRSATSLIQTSGRAARNLNGKAILYADRITDSMRRAIDETNRRRAKQVKYNEEKGIVRIPESVFHVMTNATTGAHAASGDDDVAGVSIDLLSYDDFTPRLSEDRQCRHAGCRCAGEVLPRARTLRP